MSLGSSFESIAARFGQEVTLIQGEDTLGTGKAVLRPKLDEERQILPTALGTRAEEEVLCLGERKIPFPRDQGGLVLVQGERSYDVVSARPVMAGEETLYWRAWLRRRGEEA
jgi:hypothetical protein